MAESQWPVTLAKPATPRKSAAMPAAMAQAGRAKGFPAGLSAFGSMAGRLRESASCAGQTATHSRQAVHSTERMLTSLSMGSAAGQAFAHLAQSMQGAGLRRIRTGLSQEVSPSKAP